LLLLEWPCKSLLWFFDQPLFFNHRKSKHRTIKLYTDSKQPLEAVTWYRISVSLLSVGETKEVREKTAKHCMILKEVEWICVVYDGDTFFTVVTMIINLQIPCITENFLTRWGTKEKNLSQWLLWRMFFFIYIFAFIYNSFCYFHIAVILWEHNNYICWPCTAGRALKFLLGSWWPWWFLNSDKAYCASGEMLSDGEIACCNRQNTH
jgi:hypothetical protein